MSDRPTVAWWTHRLTNLSANTGLGRYVNDCLSALARDGSQFDYELWTGAESRKTRAGVESPVPVHRLRGPRGGIHAAWMLAGRPLLESVSGRRADLIHLAYPAFPAPTRTPTIVSVHDLFPITNPEWFAPVERKGFSLAIKRLSETADRFMVISRATERELLEVAPACAGRTEVIPLGIDGRFFQPVTAGLQDRVSDRFDVGGRPYVLSVGRLSERKNQQVVIRSLAALDEEVTLVIVGPDDNRADELRELAATVAPGRVVFTGAVRDEELIALISGAACLVHPAVDEGFGFPPLEAMAAGIPVISSLGGALEETIADVSVTCPSDDPEAWASAIGDVISSHNAERIDAARQRAESFTWSTVARRLEALYCDVLGL